MYLYLSKKIAIPNNVNLYSLEWNSDHGWLACGGENGLLKVLKMEAVTPANTSSTRNEPRGIAAPTNLTMNQTLEGHSSAVICSSWNANYRKLTTSDASGLIIVWMMHRGVWVEEMINNRHKSVVTDMKWNPDGQKICIIYEDGAVIVGGVDGNRIWGKELSNELALVEWSPDSRHLLIITKEYQLHLYDHNGSKISRLPLYAVDESTKIKNYKIVGIHWYDGVEGYVQQNVPTLAIAFKHGLVQISRSEIDDDPILIDTGMELRRCRWNTNGTVLALAGTQIVRNTNSSESTRLNVVQFYDPYGVHIKSLKVPGSAIEALSWEGGGLRICLAVDSFLYFANVRPDYKWGYFCHTLVYAYTSIAQSECTVVFWNTRTNERVVKHVPNVLFIATSNDDTCVLCSANVPDHQNPKSCTLLLCDSIGSPVDSKVVPISNPKVVVMTQYHVVVASQDEVYTWHYRTPVSKLTSISHNALRQSDGRERIFHIDTSLDEVPPQIPQHYVRPTLDDVEKDPASVDPIVAMCANTTVLYVARSSGQCCRYTLPHLSLEHTYDLPCRPLSLSLNSSATRLGIVDIHNVARLYDVEVPSMEQDGLKHESCLGQVVPNFERKDVWALSWALDDPELFVVMEKARMVVYKGDLEPEPPVVTSGFLCEYTDLSVRVALLDDIFTNPEQPDRDMILDFETQSLRETSELLAKSGLQDAYDYIQDRFHHSHPTLWKLFAKTALKEADLSLAERGFVKCQDYAGVQFIKRLHCLVDVQKQQAEIALYFEDPDLAEKLYRDMDRRDLALDVRSKLGDWFRVVQLLQRGGTGDDAQLQEAWCRIGDHYADTREWKKASQYYQQGKDLTKLVRCFSKLGEFEKLRTLANELPEGNELLATIGKTFQSVGLIQEAVEAYVRLGQPKTAIDACVLLNCWKEAVALAEEYEFPQIQSLLSRYGNQLMEKGDVLKAIELYRSANKPTDAAKLLSQLAQNQHQALVAKKINVLAALEVEVFRKKMFDLSGLTTSSGSSMSTTKNMKNKTTNAAQVTAATLDNLMQQDAATGETKSLDNPWRNAEAYHLLLLAHRQLYRGKPLLALITASKLLYSDVEDVLDMSTVYSLVALSAFYTDHFESCSRAFILLSSLSNIVRYSNEPSYTQRQIVYVDSNASKVRDLAMQIFTETEPVDPTHILPRLDCPSCQLRLRLGERQCRGCARVFQTCMKTGATISDERTYVCRVCRHACLYHEVQDNVACPLCHSAMIGVSKSTP